jgi:hypothetical protein
VFLRPVTTIPVGVEFCAASVTVTETLAIVTVPVRDEEVPGLATVKREEKWCNQALLVKGNSKEITLWRD